MLKMPRLHIEIVFADGGDPTVFDLDRSTLTTQRAHRDHALAQSVITMLYGYADLLKHLISLDNETEARQIRAEEKAK